MRQATSSIGNLSDIYRVKVTMQKPLVVIESAYRATEKYTVEENIEFAKACCQFALRLGLAPFASHLFYTQLLDDDVLVQRMLGISCGYAILDKAEQVWFCFRPGEDFSDGMGLARSRAKGRWPMYPLRLSYMRFTEDGEFIEAFER